MFSKEDILKQLRDGADPQKIATAMADTINGAIREFEEEKEKASNEAAKREDARVMIDAMSNFFEKWSGVEISVSEEEREAMVDATIQLLDNVNDIDSVLETLFTDEEAKPKVTKVEDDDIIRRFLNSL